MKKENVRKIMGWRSLLHNPSIFGFHILPKRRKVFLSPEEYEVVRERFSVRREDADLYVVQLNAVKLGYPSSLIPNDPLGILTK